MARDLNDHPDYGPAAGGSWGEGELDKRDGATGSWSWRMWTLVTLVIVVIMGGVAWATIASINGDKATAAARGAEWIYIGGPDLGRGGSYVYTRCEGSRRLYLTVGGDGFPVGPVQVVDALHGAGCDHL